MRRFFLPNESPISGPLTLSGDLYRHIVTVLRLHPGDVIELAYPDGSVTSALITETGSGWLIVNPTGAPRTTETLLTIVLYQGMPKGDKLEMIIQKATELGVSRIVPFPSSRSVVKLKREKLDERVSRWTKIGTEAARQSRAAIPIIAPASSLCEAIRTCSEELRLLPWENEAATRLSAFAGRTPSSVAIMIGPEGGFSGEEADFAREHGFVTINLGPRILRTETAGIACVAMIQQLWGDMG